MRVITIVGARPQFIKAAMLSRALRAAGIDEMLVHTGQHYDAGMSEVFFKDLHLPVPHVDLGVGSGSHATQTARMMIGIESACASSDADAMLVYGDTNSTLAGAVVAAKMGLPLAHVESGLRSFDRRMPEEQNRIVADQLSDLLLAPSASAAEQLRRESVQGEIRVVGDLMVDLAKESAGKLAAEPAVLTRFALAHRSFALVTIHRASNTDDVETFKRLIAGLRALKMPVVFPAHPRIHAMVERLGVGRNDGITVCEPLPYFDMLALQKHARVVLTDSGGVQKEAVALGTPCVTLRQNTEWTETLERGWNVLVGSDPSAIVAAAKRPIPEEPIQLFAQGNSAIRIVQAVLDTFEEGRVVASCAS